MLMTDGSWGITARSAKTWTRGNGAGGQHESTCWRPVPSYSRHYRRSTAPGTLSSTKGQGGTPRALKRTQGCLRRKLSPPATPAATDQRGGRFYKMTPAKALMTKAAGAGGRDESSEPTAPAGRCPADQSPPCLHRRSLRSTLFGVVLACPWSAGQPPYLSARFTRLMSFAHELRSPSVRSEALCSRVQ